MQRIEIDEKVKNFLKQGVCIEEPIVIKGKKYFKQSYAGSGYKAVVWKFLDEFNSEVAIKFAIADEYETRSFLNEAILASKLKFYPRFAQFLDAEPKKIKMPDNTYVDFICFVEEWVDGYTLNEYISREKITATFLIGYIDMMCDALNILKYHNLIHDDLHPGNVKIAPPKRGSLTKWDSEIKIIDTGSLKHPPTKKEKDDHLWFVFHIIQIRNAVNKRKSLSLAERSFIQKIIPLIQKMLEEDPSISLIDPAIIARQFNSAWVESKTPSDSQNLMLQYPFYFISAETIQSDKLLVDLFAESCPWKKDVCSPDPLVLTGPRGCGKSTIFRRLSLKGMLYKGIEEVDNSPIAGFYLSCSTELKNRINWIQNENLAKRFRSEIIHYFNLLLIREVVHTLKIISKLDKRETTFGFGALEERSLYEFLIKKIQISEESIIHLQGVPFIEQINEIIDIELEKCHGSMVKRLSISHKTPASFLSDFSTFLSSSIFYFKSRKIVFFIDDLSTRQIPPVVQMVLNDVILLERAKNHVFKISSDKYGWEGIDYLEAYGEITREFDEIDCGKYYLLETTDNAKKHFTEELLGKRLKLSNYKGTPQELIGQSVYEERSLGKAIRSRAQKNKQINDVYFGLDTVSKMCAGDISYLLKVFAKIFELGKVEPSTHNKISKESQHQAIVIVSREYYSHIRSYQPFGEEMHAIVTHFGTLCRRILHEGKLIQQDGNFIPQETTRIEVNEDPHGSSTELKKKQRDLLRELIKRAIFIELSPGHARRGYTPSLRLNLRPILCPTFLTSFTKSIAIKWTPDEFVDFLTRPEERCNLEFEKAKSKKKATKGRDIGTDQKPLSVDE
jgi:serine/threonine protein kinase